jgi:hypothetical protein
MEKQQIKTELFNKLAEAHVFWSYAPESVTMRNISDEMFICKVLVHLDIDEINQLFAVFSKEKIKTVWEQELCIQEPYYHGLNKFLAYAYFNINNPDEYIQNIQNHHFDIIQKKGEEMFKDVIFEDD